MADHDYVISPGSSADAGELLTLQRAAYATEAQIYGEPFLPALTQRLDELIEELEQSTVLTATIGARIVGAIRAQSHDGVLHIGRITVAPDLQGRGIGSALLAAVEAGAGDEVSNFTLFTGHKSEANLRLYERKGYVRTREERLTDDVTLVHLDKPRPLA
jgi:ribosomal protein S18 acetylase RimI-like enzyme